jgi:hypothetical protein
MHWNELDIEEVGHNYFDKRILIASVRQYFLNHFGAAHPAI